jgi:hypothetical protein
MYAEIICHGRRPSYGLLSIWQRTLGLCRVSERICPSSESRRKRRRSCFRYLLQQPLATVLFMSRRLHRRYFSIICIPQRNNPRSACHQGFVWLMMERQLILYRYTLLRFKILVECSGVKGSRFRNCGRYFFHFGLLLLFCNPALTPCMEHCITKGVELPAQIT